MQHIVPYMALFMFFVLIQGCSTPEQKAQDLLRQGKYEEVVRQYPTSNAAVDARNKISEKLYSEKRYEEIISNSRSDWSWVEKSKKALAQLWFDEKKFLQILDRFPNSDLVPAARDSIAEILYNKQKYREILEIYPNSATAKKVEKYHPEIRKKIEREKQEEERERREAARQKAQERAPCRQRPSICLRLGMSSFQVRELIGSPNDVNRSVFSGLAGQQVHEQWVYETGGYYSHDAVYVYFENGILTSWQE